MPPADFSASAPYDLFSHYVGCTLCPRRCGADRLHGETGACNETASLRAARAALHFWEEPALAGSEDAMKEHGCGAVFFTGCALRCVYCQNQAISRSETGFPVTPEQLVRIYFDLAKKGASCIDLVTPDHFLPHIILSIKEAKAQGFPLPFVWNGSGYSDPDVLRLLDGLIDIYLTDFKYLDPALAGDLSAAPDYPCFAKAGLAEMVRQCGAPVYAPDGKLIRGVIVRHLVLPGHIKASAEVLRYLHETYGDSVILSILRQYTPPASLPAHLSAKYPELLRSLTKREYGRIVNAALSFGIENAYLQEAGTDKDSFIPAFDGEGILS